MRNADWENDKHLTFNMCICINISLHTYCHYNNSLISIVNYPCLFVYVVFIMKKIYVAAAAEHRCTHDGKHHYFWLQLFMYGLIAIQSLQDLYWRQQCVVGDTRTDK